MLEILESQIKDLQTEEKRSEIPSEYGHGIAAIVQAGQLEALLEHSPEAQVAQMKSKAE